MLKTLLKYAIGAFLFLSAFAYLLSGDSVSAFFLFSAGVISFPPALQLLERHALQFKLNSGAKWSSFLTTLILGLSTSAFYQQRELKRNAEQLKMERELADINFKKAIKDTLRITIRDTVIVTVYDTVYVRVSKAQINPPATLRYNSTDPSLRSFQEASSYIETANRPTQVTTARRKRAGTRSNYSSFSGSTTRGYIRGPRGGCYYYSSSGRKVYVDRSLCN